MNNICQKLRIWRKCSFFRIIEPSALVEIAANYSLEKFVVRSLWAALKLLHSKRDILKGTRLAGIIRSMKDNEIDLFEKRSHWLFAVRKLKN